MHLQVAATPSFLLHRHCIAIRYLLGAFARIYNESTACRTWDENDKFHKKQESKAETSVNVILSAKYIRKNME